MRDIIGFSGPAEAAPKTTQKMVVLWGLTPKTITSVVVAKLTHCETVPPGRPVQWDYGLAEGRNDRETNAQASP